MDLVGIMHVVDMPSAGKHDFLFCILIPNGSVLCGTVHIDFLPFHNVHPMSLVSSYQFMVRFQLVVSRALALVSVWWIFPQNQYAMFCQL